MQTIKCTEACDIAQRNKSYLNRGDEMRLLERETPKDCQIVNTSCAETKTFAINTSYMRSVGLVTHTW